MDDSIAAVEEVCSKLLPTGTPFVHNGQIFIRSPANPSEWSYIELQGELQNIVRPSAHKGPLSGSSGDHLWTMNVGEFSDDPKRPRMRIGNNLLVGTRTRLSKPLLVTQREPDVPDAALASSPDAQSDAMGVEPGRRLRVLGVIVSKVVFDTRPMPIITSLAQ